MKLNFQRCIAKKNYFPPPGMRNSHKAIQYFKITEVLTSMNPMQIFIHLKHFYRSSSLYFTGLLLNKIIYFCFRNTTLSKTANLWFFKSRVFLNLEVRNIMSETGHAFSFVMRYLSRKQQYEFLQASIYALFRQMFLKKIARILV